VDGISHMSDVDLIRESKTGFFFARENYDAWTATEAVSRYFRICGCFCEISLQPGENCVNGCRLWNCRIVVGLLTGNTTPLLVGPLS
jgi:hypothetical protein